MEDAKSGENAESQSQQEALEQVYGFVIEQMQAGACVIPISRAAGANTVALAERIKSTIEDLKTEIPGSVKLDIFYDK